MATVLVTGANRGLGLEFATQYAARGWRVFACCRNPAEAGSLNALASGHPGKVSVHALDVRSGPAIAALARSLAGQPLDVLLNNAGIYGPPKMFFGQIDYPAWAEVFAVNTMAPVQIAEAFVEHVAASEKRLMAFVSSAMGSIAANTEGRHYLYRTTKAALNAASKCMALDLRGRGITVVTLHPGWVKTDMGGPHADLEAADSVGNIIRTLDAVTLADSGRFLNHDGSDLPW